MIEKDKIEDGSRALEFLQMQGYTKCNNPACNCPYWHRGNASERLTEIHNILNEAGLEPHRKTAITVAEELIEEHNSRLTEPAFPVDCNINPDSRAAGMRLRDYFAGKVIGSVQAYKIADEMLKARGEIPCL